MNKKALIIFTFLVSFKNVFALKAKSFIKIKKDITDERESLVDIQFFDIKRNLIDKNLIIRASLFRKEPYNNGTYLKLGLPFRIAFENIFLGLKGANDDYFLTISNKGIEGNIKLYIKALFENEKKNMKYGFQSSMAHYNDNEIKFTLIEPYLKHSFEKNSFKFKTKFRAGIKEYYKTEKPVSSIKEIFFLKSKPEKSLPEKLQEVEKMLKIKNKKYKETFLKIFLKQKYRLTNEFSVGAEQKIDYSIISINPISKVFIELSPFLQIKYELIQNLHLSHKCQFIFSHGFNVLNNSIYLLFRTSLDYNI